MSCIAVVNLVPGLDDRQVAFWAEACNLQAREVAGVWGVQYTPVVFYGKAEGLPVDCRIMTVQADLDVPGALGYHTDDLGVVLARVKVSGQTSITMSHEEAEETVDPTSDRWDPFDDDHEQAHEVSDRVEGDSYMQAATILGETRQVPVSNYLLPSAFDPAGRAPFDRMGKLTSWNGMTPGGYVIVRDITTGKVGDVFAQRAPRVLAGPGAERVLAEKMANRGSRLRRRLGI